MIRVKIVRPGTGVEDLSLNRGTTFADFLHRLGGAMNQVVYLDGFIPDESTPIHDGAVVTILPESRQVEEPWRTTIPSFRDDDLFREYVGLLESRRREPDPDEDEVP